MTYYRLRVSATGRQSASSSAAELIVLGWSHDDGTPRFGEDNFGPDWESANQVDIGNNRRLPNAMKTETGEAIWQFSNKIAVYVLAHAWSGIHRLWCNGQEIEIDLYNSKPEIRLIEGPELNVRSVTEAEIDELLYGLSMKRPDQGVVTLKPFGRVVIEDITTSMGDKLDLTSIVCDSAESIAEVVSVDRDGSISLHSEVRLTLERGSVIALKTSPEGGQLTVEGDGGISVVSLASEIPGRKLLCQHEKRQTGGRHFLLFEEEVRSYSALLAKIDPTQPVALHVPRWMGVSSSTVNLFSQRLPIPLTPATPPEKIASRDIDRYARMILSTGAEHFVVSGGDLFFIRLIRAVHRLAPDIRFDLLWHSNYLAMSHPSDWAMLRQWLGLHASGEITRIGVVKEGLDTFLKDAGVDSVFIPNIIEVDGEGIRASEHDGSVGLWLPRASDYRKLPYASLLALASLNKYPLRASNLDEVGRQVVAELRLPVRRLWPGALPRALLYREMSATLATLYVTLSDCSPMLPLESFALGVPCIVGPSSHLFRHDEKLKEWLVVTDPQSPAAIAKKLERVAADRTDVVDSFRAFYKRECEAAREGVARLLE